MHAKEIPHSDIFHDTTSIASEYGTWLDQALNNGILPDPDILTLNYTTVSNFRNDHTLDGNVYILHDGHVAIMSGNKHRQGKGSDVTELIALQFLKTPGLILNPLALSDIRTPDRTIHPLVTSELLVLPQHTAHELFLYDSQFRYLAYNSVLQSLSSLQEQIALRSQDKFSLSRLLAGFLLYNHIDNLVAITHQDLASLLGTDRPSVSRLISKMYDEGLLERNGRYGELKIQDPEGLAAWII